MDANRSENDLRSINNNVVSSTTPSFVLGFNKISPKGRTSLDTWIVGND